MAKKKEEKPKGKETVRVYVMYGPDTSGIVASSKIVDEKIKYKGYSWDLFQAISNVSLIKNKYDFDFTFSELGKNNYNQSIKDANDDKYDVLLGSYIHTEEREKLINFTTPIAIDAVAVFHEERSSLFETFKDVFIKVSYLIGILILFGILAGAALYLINPKRVGKTRAKSTSEFFYRSIMTGIATFFGEMGFLSENTTNNFKGVFLVVIIMLIAFIFILFLQAEITSSIIERKTQKGLTKRNLADRPILGHEGYAMAQKLVGYGGNVEFMKDKTNQDLFDMYVYNKGKYNGVVLTYCDGFPYKGIIPDLYASVNFGNEPVSFPVNPRKIELLDDINKAILYLRSTGALQKICFSYFGDIANIPACTLN